MPHRAEMVHKLRDFPILALMNATPTTSQLSQIRDQLVRAQDAGHRSLLVLSGSQTWGRHAVESILALAPRMQTWKVSTHYTGYRTNCFPASHIGQRLGQECDVLIWDGFSGIDPDGLAAATGLIRAGGLLILVLPPKAELFAQKDPDYLRMCVNDAERASCSSYFLQRLCRVLNDTAEAIHIKEAETFNTVNDAECRATPHLPIAKPSRTLPTADQLCAINAIVSASSGVLLLSAQRGRGKSSALGLACARILLQSPNTRIIVSAASKQHASIALLHFENEYARLNGHPPAPSQLVFHAPDVLIQTLPECGLLVIDEAAMLPVPILLRLCQHYSNCVLATTTDGYEGTGQGFLLRFRAALDRLGRCWHQIELKQAIRWADGDPLEQTINTALLLKYSDLNRSARPETFSPEETYLAWIDQHQLAADEILLQQIVGLLTEAHYQTRPSDLRMLLDHPRIRIAVIRQSQYLLAAQVLIAEGDIYEAKLAEGLICGTRRPRGHMIPQALTQFSGDSRWLSLKSLRVMRIAVQPNLSRQKLGSRLLAAAHQKAGEEGMDYLSTSYGLTDTLLPFWLGNHYRLLRIGYHLDAASACHSANMVLPLSELAGTLAQQVQQRFSFLYQHLRRTHFADLDVDLAARVQTNLPEQPKPEHIPELLKAISDGHRMVEDTLPELLHLFEQEEVKQEVERLTAIEQSLLDLRLVQGLSWQRCALELKLSGKKTAEQSFRQLVKRLRQ